MNTKTVRVTRAFFYQGKPLKLGDTLDVPATFAAELIASRKAEAVGTPEQKEIKPAEKAKGVKDAG